MVHNRGGQEVLDMDSLLSLKTVAQRTETSVALWRKALTRRLLPSVRVGRAVRIRERDLAAFLAKREQPARERVSLERGE
jgi:excisionase family DNA binding protein